ncbi:phosphoglycerate dehydrogenase [Alkalilimnicola ehrlichii MLHE-1]|uniref:D-3-phosphoglycerate dehydrogenase n=1 Tax=Alkalilimnicola ehrlichii (strain ATCC BAA-1101 / DSM 17681 / MLHE-1) TaxID=187272 RepID=Q0AA58_ALKEH|nr:phosphoglycerate dehydrogenase [Alkalilimnicola ehrlichii]ABI56279.1 D-3-phosphoglycerate dehydrogenase [Alkalilimnicola ehrlichii MLHE-1]
MFRILTFNNISVKGLERFPRDHFETSSDIAHPDAIMLRSHKLQESEVADTVLAVGRAGAGVNNIPVEAMSRRGVPVFNAPGANANAVKELTIAGLFLAARNICQAWDFARALEGSDQQINAEVEAGKKRFTGFELPGRTLGVIGLGAIGVEVANAAMALGMKVVGYDPQITVHRAWQLSSQVEQAHSVDELMSRADVVTIHAPLNEATRGLINGSRLAAAHPGLTVLNFARSEVVDEQAILEALDRDHLRAYICDFPSNALKGRGNVIALPHLGASTVESQENCAVMVADQLREYLETGNIRNAVNFPEVVMPRGGKGNRLCVVNANVPNMLGRISTALAEAGLNIDDMYNKSHEELAYTVVDVEGAIPESVVQAIAEVEGVLRVRVIE